MGQMSMSTALALIHDLIEELEKQKSNAAMYKILFESSENAKEEEVCTPITDSQEQK